MNRKKSKFERYGLSSSTVEIVSTGLFCYGGILRMPVTRPSRRLRAVMGFELVIRSGLVRIDAVNHFVTRPQKSDDCAANETDNRPDPGRSASTNGVNAESLR